MNCEEALVLLSGHLDHENTAEEEAQLQTHLQACPDCRQLLAAFEAADAGLLSLEAEPPADFRDGVMNAIRQEAAGKKKRRSVWAGLAVAAALTVVVGTTALRSAGQSNEAAAPQAAAFRTMVTEEAAAAPEPAAETAPNVQAAMDSVSIESAMEQPDTDEAMLFTAEPNAGASMSNDLASCDPQTLADLRGADVAVTGELLPEMELCPCETLENGLLLYCLEGSDAAAELSRLYGVELFRPAQYGSENVSYALLLQ